MVTIHSKVVVIDPFGEKQVVIFGSHNLGPKASGFNDDNMNIVVNNASLAEQYAVNIISVYDHFHWRYALSLDNPHSKAFKGLVSDTMWMQSYLTPAHQLELDFLLGAREEDGELLVPADEPSAATVAG